MEKQSDEYYYSFIKDTKLIKDNTKKLYLNKLAIIQTQVYDKWSLHDIITQPDTFMIRFKEFSKISKRGTPLSSHSQETYISSLLALFIYNSKLKEIYFEQFQKWNKIHEEIRRPIDLKYKSNQPTDKQQQAYLDYDEIVRIRNNLEIGSPYRLLLSMYTYIPPLRSDYYRTKIYTSLEQFEKDNKDEEKRHSDNLIVLDDVTKKYFLVLEKYKTSKTYGVKLIDLPQELVNEIKVSLTKHPRGYLFISPVTGDAFNKEINFNVWANRHLKKVTGKPTFTISMLRHIYITRRDLKLEEKSGLEQNQIASMMGHSVEQQRKYMWHTYLKNMEQS